MDLRLTSHAVRWHRKESLLTDLAQKVASDLEKIGIKLNIVAQDWNGGYADDYQ